MVTNGPFSTSPGSTASPVPYLTGAFAGSGNFTVSPILGYQKGGLNTDGTPNTTSRQFQAGLSVTGQGAAQNATLFVMTSAISNAPNIGFYPGWRVHGSDDAQSGRMVRSGQRRRVVGDAEFGAQQRDDLNGVPIASFTLNNTLTNLITGTVSNNQSYNYIQSGHGELQIQSDHDGNADDPCEQPSDFSSEWLCRRRDGDGDRRVRAPPFANFTKPYVITNLTGQPGDVGIFLPGNSSEMLASFNVGSVNAPTNGMTSSNYIFGSLNGNNQTGLNGARGTYVNPSNFAARDAAVFDNGANIPVSSRNGQSLASIGGYANQQLVTAGSRRRKYVRISDLDLLRPLSSPARANPHSGVSGAPSTAQATTVN